MKKTLPSPIYATIAGFCLFAISMCLARVAYGPLIPSMINTEWVTKAEAGYLGAFNGLGYIVGCLMALWLPQITGIRLLMRSSLILAVIGIGMCFWNLGFAWLSLGRFLSGSGAAIMVIHTTALVVRSFNEKSKEQLLGFAISGGGIAIVIISMSLPYFVKNGPSDGWLLEAIITLFVALIAWPFISTVPHQRQPSKEAIQPLESRRGRLVLLTGISYLLMSISILPHTLFMTDYMHRDLGLSVGDSSSLFAVLGLGCAFGAIFVGMLTRLFGTRMSLFISYIIGVSAIAMVLIFDSIMIVASSSFLIGMSFFGAAALSSIRTLEIVGLSRHAHFWGFMALGWGLGIGGGSYAMSVLLSLGFNYIDLFKMAQIIIILSLILILFSWWRYNNVEDFDKIK
ncbi:YbfB/YjiJ family MFS transporter [Flavobacteriaceae bacterium]|nr:YbfB/YjiJ family MFS transporter [Flavobacteriaceae bacterium]